MKIRRVGPRNSLQAKNFISQQARERLWEVSDAAAEIQTNSIFVHASPVVYFSQIKHGYTCTCRATEITPDSGSSINLGDEDGDSLDLNFKGSLFGRNSKSDQQVVDDQFDDDLESVDTGTHGNDLNGLDVFANDLFSGARDCGVCMRTGNVPGYQPIGYDRQVLSTHHVLSAEGYTINKREAPHTFEQEHGKGCVDFQLEVPYVFHEVWVSVYNNLEKVSATLKIGKSPLGLQLLHSLAGQSVTVSLSKCPVFTHVVFMFRLTDSQTLGDFPQDSRPLDYTIFDTIQPVQIVIDRSVPQVANSDVVLRLRDGKTWKVTDYTNYQLSDGKVLGWTLSARVLQSTEMLAKIMDIDILDVD